MRGFEIVREGTGFRVRGKAIERLVLQTDFDREESAERFQHEMVRQGIETALRRAGCRNGDSVMIGAMQLDWEDADETELLDAADAAEALELDRAVAAVDGGRGDSEGGGER